ncbi:MAG: hypothetical protein KY476_08205 [Planctomycetes bacterium]|nr:hypothetical protein [Planctomycetota bacterium]
MEHMTTIEVACPSCNGRLMAIPGTLVACPHCQQHLQIPEPEPVAAPAARPAAPEQSSRFAPQSHAAAGVAAGATSVPAASQPSATEKPPAGAAFGWLTSETEDGPNEFPDFSEPSSARPPMIADGPAAPGAAPVEAPATSETPPVAFATPAAPESERPAAGPSQAPAFPVVPATADQRAPIQSHQQPVPSQPPAPTPRDIGSGDDSPAAAPPFAEAPSHPETVAAMQASSAAPVEQQIAMAPPAGDIEAPPQTIMPWGAPEEPSAASLEAHYYPPAANVESFTGAATAAPAGAVAPARRRGGEPMVPRLWFLLACSYASAVTLALLYVAFLAPPHPLESLPDVVPKRDAAGNIQVSLYPIDVALPPGHVLSAAEDGERRQRFGNLEVEVLKVTRGPLEFTHYTGESNYQPQPTAPVLKLWLRLKNVSEDQTFAPLGQELVYKRGRGKRDKSFRANNFVCRLGDDGSRGDCVLVYDHLVSGEFDIKGQFINRGLKPGQEFETFIPTTEEGLEDLQGELIWRVHLRKGLGPSGWGVTTLVEVRFKSSDVIDETT